MKKLIFQTETEAPFELVGGKGKGLLKLKSLESILNKEIYRVKIEVPNFFIVSPQIKLGENYKFIIDAIKQINTEKYAVRSSSVLEDVSEHSFDGIFDTHLDVPKEKVFRAIHQVRKSAKSNKAIKYAQEIGVTLSESMPVIVQAMVLNQYTKGIVYSKFPSPHDITKVVRDDVSEQGREITVYSREIVRGRAFIEDSKPLVVSRYYQSYHREYEALANLGVTIENKIGYPVIIEFASLSEGCIPNRSDKLEIKLLQARKLTNITEAEKFQMPELQEKWLIASTSNLNGVGDVIGQAYVTKHDMDTVGVNDEDYLRLRQFDGAHPEGYILITPYLKFNYTYLDEITPNKKAVIAYSDLGEHHDFEIARKKGILYLACDLNLHQKFFEHYNLENKPAPIKNGDKIRLVSDGKRGFVYKLD